MATIMEQHSQVQAKNTHFNNVQESIDDLDRWIIENPDAPIELPHPSSAERKFDLTALDHCQQVRKRADRETTSSMVICSQ
jgi:hypothetical protein